MLCCRKAFVDLWLFVGLKATEQGWQASKQAMNLIYFYQQKRARRQKYVLVSLLLLLWPCFL
jgi:hypothetical protein